MQSNAPCAGGGSAGMATPPLALIHAEESERSCTQEAAESESRPCVENQLSQRLSSPARSRGAGGGAAVGGATSSRGVRGWAKFRNATSAAPPPPAIEQEKQPQKDREWPEGAQPSEQLAAASKNRESEETGSTEGGNSAGEAGEETSALHTPSPALLLYQFSAATLHLVLLHPASLLLLICISPITSLPLTLFLHLHFHLK